MHSRSTLRAITAVAVASIMSVACCHAQTAGKLDPRDVDPDPLPKSALMRLGSTRLSSPDGVMELLLSSDGQTLVSFGHYVIGWDVATGKELWRQGRGYLPACYGNQIVTLSPDGRSFWELVDDHVIECNLRSGRTKSIAVDFNIGRGRSGDGARCIEVSSDGQFVFVGSGQGYTVYDRNWDVLYKDKQQLPAVVGNRDRLTFGGPYAYGAFSPSGKLLALVTSAEPKSIRIMESANGKVLGTIECVDNAVRYEFSPDGKSLAVTERDTAVRIYDSVTQERRWECIFDVDKRSENYTSALAFSPDGKHLFVCERNQTVFQVDVADGSHTGTIEGHSWNPWALEFSHDGQSFYSSGWGGTIHQWESDTLAAIPLPIGYRGTNAITLSPDGKSCAHVDQSGNIHLISRSSKQESALLNLPEGEFEVLEFSPDSLSLCAGGSWKGEVHIVEWNLDSEQVSGHWQWPIGEDPVTGVEDIVYSPDEARLLVSIFRQDAAYLLDRSSKARIKLPHPNVYGSTFSPDGRAAFTAGWDKKVRAWDGTSGELLTEVAVESEHRDSRMYTVTSDPANRYLAIAGMTENIALYDPNTLELIREWDVGGSFVYGSLRFTPDGLWLASGNAGGRILVWDPETGERIHEIDGHDDSVYTLDFGKDNRTLCSGGANLGYIWDLKPADLPFDHTEDAIKALVGVKGSESYQAWWYLTEKGEACIEPLVAYCERVEKLLDVEKLLAGLVGAQRECRLNLIHRLVQQDNTNQMTFAAARRIFSVLAHIDGAGSQNAIRRLQNRDFFSDVLNREK
ncbi:MAG: WD40 repeat domain-containing protein [Planctomycetota bacterium]